MHFEEIDRHDFRIYAGAHEARGGFTAGVAVRRVRGEGAGELPVIYREEALAGGRPPLGLTRCGLALRPRQRHDGSGRTSHPAGDRLGLNLGQSAERHVSDAAWSNTLRASAS
jgi:hypothetical protein